jgi:hypothetical protein
LFACHPVLVRPSFKEQKKKIKKKKNHKYDVLMIVFELKKKKKQVQKYHFGILKNSHFGCSFQFNREPKEESPLYFSSLM